jgi:hypothetical protein
VKRPDAGKQARPTILKASNQDAAGVPGADQRRFIGSRKLFLRGPNPHDWLKGRFASPKRGTRAALKGFVGPQNKNNEQKANGL